MGMSMGLGFAPPTVPTNAISAGAGIATAGIAAGLTLAAAGISQWINSARLRGSQKIGASNIANEAELLLQRNLSAFESAPKTAANKELATANYFQVTDWMRSSEGCGNPQLGSAGQRCISERLGSNDTGDGSAFTWRAWYLEPILNTPVVDVPIQGSGAGAGYPSTNPNPSPTGPAFPGNPAVPVTGAPGAAIPTPAPGVEFPVPLPLILGVGLILWGVTR